MVDKAVRTEEGVVEVTYEAGFFVVEGTERGEGGNGGEWRREGKLEEGEDVWEEDGVDGTGERTILCEFAKTGETEEVRAWEEEGRKKGGEEEGAGRTRRRGGRK